MAKGEMNVLTAESPSRFCLTSGTTGKGKMIPIVPSFEKSLLTHASSMTSKIIADTFPNISPLHKSLWFYTSPKMRRTDGGHQLGPMSRIQESMKKVLVSQSSPPDGFDVETLYESTYIHLLFGLFDRDVSKILAGFTTTFYNAMKQLEKDWLKLVEDIRIGSINADLKLPQNIRDALQKAMVSDSDRAKELEVEFEKGFDGILRRIWPRLVCVIVIDIGGHKEKLINTYAKGVTLYGHLYASSEGIIAINLWPDIMEERYALFPDIMFYEFIPEDIRDRDQPETKLIHELQIGESYEILLTTSFGFCRYRFGDVIKCVGYHDNTPLIAFQYRSGQLLNLHGEKVSQLITDKAIKDAASHWPKVSVVDYACAESLSLSEESLKKFNQKTTPFYLIFIELEGESRNLTSQEKRMQLWTGHSSFWKMCPQGHPLFWTSPTSVSRRWYLTIWHRSTSPDMPPCKTALLICCCKAALVGGRDDI
ncbi:uncharacterized protein [Amphiura filiformis]|uniref:uncharacterized protein n=1 Tax=Amphiura filiformis TaxID=82378 RepID=UPI003B2136F4